MYQTVFVAFFFLFSTTTVSAIKCYVCKSSKDPSVCGDPFNQAAADKADMLKECSHALLEAEPTGSIPPSNATFFCRKGYQMVHGKEHVYRSCGWEKFWVEGRECYFTAVESVKSTNCQCHSDGCNSAMFVSLDTVALLANLLPLLSLFF